MCGRFTTAFTEDEAVKEFSIRRIDDHFKKRSYNVSPRQEVPVVRIVDGQRTLSMLRWGLIPSWADDPKVAFRTINARSETLFERAAFKRPAEDQRCLVIADGFYEWKNSTERGMHKTPFYITLTDRKIFGFAGLWDSWKDSEGENLEACTIITTKPNTVVSPLHDRMPVIIKKDDEGAWLDPKKKDRAAISSLLGPYDPNRMTAFMISNCVNDPRNDSAEAMKPIGEAGEKVFITKGAGQPSILRFAKKAREAALPDVKDK